MGGGWGGGEGCLWCVRCVGVRWGLVNAAAGTESYSIAREDGSFGRWWGWVGLELVGLRRG